MAATPIHIQNSLKRTGKDFRAVHEWLDNCRVDPFISFNKYPLQHRLERHTPQGLEFIEKTWGKEALIEAVHHLQEDGYKLKIVNGKVIWL